MSDPFKTPKGTYLPLLDLHGKHYLEVKYRLIWFREEKPNWSIETKPLQLTDKVAVFQATIKDETGRVISQGTKHDSVVLSREHYIETAETGSIGRALALCGFGTQFCGDELNEGERIADAPVPSKTQTQSTPAQNGLNCQACGTKLRETKKGDAYNCPNWKDQSKGKHTYVKKEFLQEALPSREDLVGDSLLQQMDDIPF